MLLVRGMLCTYTGRCLLLRHRASWKWRLRRRPVVGLCIPKVKEDSPSGATHFLWTRQKTQEMLCIETMYGGFGSLFPFEGSKIKQSGRQSVGNDAQRHLSVHRSRSRCAVLPGTTCCNCSMRGFHLTLLPNTHCLNSVSSSQPTTLTRGAYFLLKNMSDAKGAGDNQFDEPRRGMSARW